MAKLLSVRRRVPAILVLPTFLSGFLWEWVGHASTVQFLIVAGKWVGGADGMMFLSRWGWIISVGVALVLSFLGLTVNLPEHDDKPLIVVNTSATDLSGPIEFTKQIYDDAKTYRDQKDAAEMEVRRLTTEVAQIKQAAETSRQERELHAGFADEWEKRFYKMERNFNLVVDAYDKIRSAYGHTIQRYDLAEDVLEKIGIALQDPADNDATLPLSPEEKLDETFAALAQFFGAPIATKRLPRRTPPASIITPKHLLSNEPNQIDRVRHAWRKMGGVSASSALDSLLDGLLFSFPSYGQSPLAQSIPPMKDRLKAAQNVMDAAVASDSSESLNEVRAHLNEHHAVYVDAYNLLRVINEKIPVTDAYHSNRLNYWLTEDAKWRTALDELSERTEHEGPNGERLLKTLRAVPLPQFLPPTPPAP